MTNRIRLVIVLAGFFLLVGADMSAQTTSQRRVEVESVALLPQGFEPKRIQRPPGRFLLAVTNLTGIEDIFLELHPVTAGVRGQKVMDKRTQRGLPRWTPSLDLTPGEYVLGEVNHPRWVLTIVITPGK